MKRPITCTMGHPLDENGYHLIPDSDKHHGRLLVPIDEYDPPEIPPQRMIHTVNVVHSHKPRPRPNTIAFRIRSWDGRDYRTAPVNVYGQATSPVHFPIEWVTGRSEDLKVPDAQIVAEFWYPEER